MTDAEMSAWCRAEAANWTSAASHYADDSGMRRVQEERAATLLQIAKRLVELQTSNHKPRWLVTAHVDGWKSDGCAMHMYADSGDEAIRLAKERYPEMSQKFEKYHASPHSDGSLVQEPQSGTPYDATTAENWRIIDAQHAHAPQHPIEEG